MDRGCYQCDQFRKTCVCYARTGDRRTVWSRYHDGELEKSDERTLGFTEFVEVGLGGDLTAKYEAEEWREAYQNGEKKVTSCCPGFVNMVRKHYPELSDRISTTVSPMCGVSRMIKAKDPEAVTVFIGPCLAKKSEIVDQKIEGNADYAMTYSEIRAMMRAKGVALEPVENTYQGSIRIRQEIRQFRRCRCGSAGEPERIRK